MKTVLFVPGGMEYYNTRNYTKVLSTIRKRGYKVVFVPINWKRTVLSEWANELEKVYAKYDPKNTILCGFSWGSMTAFLAATKRPPKELWLFSFSPYFKEDLDTLPKWVMKFIGKRREKDFRSLSLVKLAKDLKSKTLVFVGEAEAKRYSQMDRNAKRANRVIKNSTLIVVPEAPHDVTHPNYLKAISENI